MTTISTVELTTKQIAGVTQVLRNTKRAIEAEQEAPLNTDQVTTIYDLCLAININPIAVLSQSANLIHPKE